MLVCGIANEHSIAYGCAKAFHELGANLAITYLNEKSKAYVEPLARAAGGAASSCRSTSRSRASSRPSSRAIEKEWGRLDVLVHSIAWAPKDDLQGGLLNCSAEGFAKAMDVSCHSFVRMARLAAPLMKDGGTMFTMSYYGANKVVPNYNVMGPVKAALEASARYLAYELGPKGIRVHPDLAGAAEDPRRLRPQGLRPAAHRGGAARAARRTGRHHGRRLHLRVPGHAVCAAAVGRDAVRRRRRAHHGLVREPTDYADATR